MHHVKINEIGSMFAVCDQNKFASIPELVAHFGLEDLAFFQGGTEAKFKVR